MLCIYVPSIILYHGTKCMYMSPIKKKDALFNYSVLAFFIFLLITKAEAFCGEKTSLSAKEGTHLVLRPAVAETEAFTRILWIKDDLNTIEIQYLNKSAVIQYNINDEKINISADGSLTVNNFNMEDQGMYIVIIQLLNQLDCKHTFYVSMSEKSPCEDIRNVSGREEEEITLPLDTDGVQVKMVSWFSPRRDLLTKTKPGEYIQHQSDHDRRVKILADGSLTITKLTMKDQGIFVAKVHTYSGKTCSQEYNVSISGVIFERANTKKVHILSYEGQKVTLPLPEHLMYQVEDVFWMKDYAEHIATTFKNGSLHVLDSRYQGRLNSTSHGSLIILHLHEEDRGIFSADIHLISKGFYTEIYYLSIHKKSYYISYETKNISVTEGGDLILQNDLKQIKSIDWRTPRWIRFAVTKLGGDICIFGQYYTDRLSSLSDGSIIIKRVTKKDEGIYTAHTFSHNGKLLEQQYLVSIDEDLMILYVLAGVVGFLIVILILIISIVLYYVSKEKRKNEVHEVTEPAQEVSEKEKRKNEVHEVTEPAQEVSEKAKYEDNRLVI